MFVASLDRTNTTPREAMHTVAPALKAAGVDVDNIVISTSSIYRARKKVRQLTVEHQKELFVPDIPLVAHFDSKLLPDSDGNLVDRMPVVVSGMNIEKLLSIPKLPTGTGELMGNAVIQALQEWKGVPECLAGLCFDTTSSNTGVHSGAITVIQQAFNKRLLFLACRHHILEIVAAAVFEMFFPSSGPQIGIFSRFKENWKCIDQSCFAPLDKDTGGNECLTEAEKDWLEQKKQEIVSFLHSQLSQADLPRDDYLEFLKLCLVILDERQPGKESVQFSPPGAYHRARWMAKGIYCLKIYCFREQFRLTLNELKAMKHVVLFTVTIYVKAWFTAPSSCDAPLNDLCLLQILESYNATHTQVANIALKKIK
jgi:hypothetical protein